MPKRKSNLKDIEILLGVTGSVAVFKAVELASQLTAIGAAVTTVMTENACRLVQPKSFEAVTARQVFTSLWSEPGEYKIEHVSLAEAGEIVVVAPATANIIAKVANGICDDLLSTTLTACWQKPLLIAPAMNNNMWTNPVVKQNMKILKGRNWQVVGPATGRLACGGEGIGRMAEPADILIAIDKIAAKLKHT